MGLFFKKNNQGFSKHKQLSSVNQEQIISQKWRIINKTPHPKNPQSTFVLLERIGNDGFPLYQRLFLIYAGTVDKGEEYIFNEVNSLYDAHFFAETPKKWNEFSPHFKEAVISRLQDYCTPFNTLNSKGPHDWFRGLNFDLLWKEIKEAGFRVTTGIYDRSYSTHLITWNKALNVYPDGRQEIDLMFITSIHLFVAVDWTGVDVMSIINGPKITFPVRDEPFPELDVYYKGPDPQVVYINNQQQEDNTPRCPTCKSTNIEKITTLNKVVSIELLGLASNKIGKQFKCKNCGYMW